MYAHAAEMRMLSSHGTHPVMDDMVLKFKHAEEHRVSSGYDASDLILGLRDGLPRASCRSSLPGLRDEITRRPTVAVHEAPFDQRQEIMVREGEIRWV
jgi:hypothetical protein